MRYQTCRFWMTKLPPKDSPKTSPAVAPAGADRLHGITLAALLEALVARYGWEGLAQRIDIRCFKLDPSIKSSLTFLRRTPWAREQVEELYLRGSETDC